MTWPDPFELPDDDEPSDSGVWRRPPDHTMDDSEVENAVIEYSLEKDGTYRIAGPLGNFRPKDERRRFSTVAAAAVWAKRHFGARFYRMVHDGETLGLWCAEVKKP